MPYPPWWASLRDQQRHSTLTRGLEGLGTRLTTVLCMLLCIYTSLLIVTLCTRVNSGRTACLPLCQICPSVSLDPFVPRYAVVFLTLYIVLRQAHLTGRTQHWASIVHSFEIQLLPTWDQMASFSSHCCHGEKPCCGSNLWTPYLGLDFMSQSDILTSWLHGECRHLMLSVFVSIAPQTYLERAQRLGGPTLCHA